MRKGQKVDLARDLRRHMTDAERALWRHLCRRQLCDYRFRRQSPIGPYIADFACLERRLVIEVDGGQHCDSASDQARDRYLRRAGFRVLRFWNHDVLGNIEGVVHVITQALQA